MKFLLFRLYAPLASWGDVAVGEFRPSLGYPGRSSLLGLLGAALGIDRDDDTRYSELDRELAFAVAVYSEGTLLRDFHTAQVPGATDLKGRPHRTRADELTVPRHDLNTILSTRDYRQDALCVAGVWTRNDAAVHLGDVRAALERPRFALYLGRKACPPAMPLSPQVMEANDFRAALDGARFPGMEELSAMKFPNRPLRVAWEGPPDVAGWAPSFSVSRKDAPLSRRRWQFCDRTERVALIATTEGAESTEEDGAP